MLPMAEIILPQLSTNVPAFLAKLWKMVDDPLRDHLISWGPMGNTFVIHNQADFSRELLPFYYKHNNMASFVRQLNMYGFHKVVGVEAGGLKSENDQEMEFSHKYFIRGQEVLLTQIKRKVATNKAVAANVPALVPTIKNEKVTEVLNEVAQLKDKQEDMDSKLDTMKKENEALWREVINLRHKHTNQQKIVNKLIHFLMGCLQGGIQTGHGVKRRFQTLQPLAIESRSSPNKQAKLDIPGTSSSQGPVILDVTNDQMVAQAAVPSVVPAAQASATQSPQMDTLAQAMQAVDPKLVNPAISLRTPIKENNPGSRPALKRELSREDFDADTFQMQTEIDNLKDILSGQITLDSSLISNLFNPNEPLMTMNFNQDNNSSGTGGATLPIEMETTAEEANKIIDQQLDQPSLFELADEYENELMGPPAAGTLSNTQNDFPSLETPLLTDDTFDTNPLLAQITSQKTPGKKQKF